MKDICEKCKIAIPIGEPAHLVGGMVWCNSCRKRNYRRRVLAWWAGGVSVVLVLIASEHNRNHESVWKALPNTGNAIRFFGGWLALALMGLVAAALLNLIWIAVRKLTPQSISSRTLAPILVGLLVICAVVLFYRENQTSPRNKSVVGSYIEYDVPSADQWTYFTRRMGTREYMTRVNTATGEVQIYRGGQWMRAEN